MNPTITALLLMYQMFCGIDAQQCRSEYSIRGMMLKRHIFKEMKTADWLKCVQRCNDNVRCQSFNYMTSGGICELNDRTKEARPEDFVTDRDRFYIKRLDGRVPLGSIPELPAVSCAEIKASERENAVSGNYWFNKIKPGVVIMAPCNMSTQDADECNASVPLYHVNANCHNTVGSFTCACKTGFSGDGFSCSDLDECSTNNHTCDVKADCMNTKGSYSCNCTAGYTGDGQTCNDIDECAIKTDNCSLNALCNNTDGSFSCTCKPGFHGNSFNCTDIDECAIKTDNCSLNAICNNTKGAFNCTCKPGFHGDGINCNAKTILKSKLRSRCKNIKNNKVEDTQMVMNRLRDQLIAKGMIKAWRRKLATKQATLLNK